MTRVHVAGIALVVFIAACTTARAGVFTIESTQVSVGINGGFPNVVGGGFSNVSSPFVDSITRTLLQSAVHAGYTFIWAPDTGDFSINSSISCQGPISQSSFGCGSSGRFDVLTTADVLLSSDISLTWHLPSGDREGIIDFNVVKLGVATPLLSRACGSGLASGGAPDGTCGFIDNTLLPAGGHYRVIYAINFRNYSGSPTVLSTGTSAINLHLEAVPEPATAGLLACCGLILIRKRTQRDNLSGR